MNAPSGVNMAEGEGDGKDKNPFSFKTFVKKQRDDDECDDFVEASRRPRLPDVSGGAEASRGRLTVTFDGWTTLDRFVNQFTTVL